MLSRQEKEEMLADARDTKRRDDFRRCRRLNSRPLSFEEYLKFLNDIQRLFAPFALCRRPMITVKNKL